MDGISVCPSVALSHSGFMSKRGNAEGCNLYHRVAQCLRFSDAKNGWWGGWPCPDKSWVQKVDPCDNCRAVHISPHNSGTVIDSENSSINVNRKWNMGFPMSHQPKSCVTPNVPKMVFRWPNLSFLFAEMSTKTLQVGLCHLPQSFILSENFQPKSWNFQRNQLPIEQYQHFGRGWPRCRKIWAYIHRPQYEERAFLKIIDSRYVYR